MPKSGVVGPARRTAGQFHTAELQDAVEGQIAEICRDLAVQGKRMRQMQDQARELQTAIRQWVRQSEATSDREPANREGRR